MRKFYVSMQYPKVTVGLILYKGEKYLSQSLPSLFAQDYPNIEFLVRDQSPAQEALKYVQENLPEIAQKIHIEPGENLMHSGGHNVLMRKMTGEYYFCCSYDMFYSPDFISKIVTELQKPENKKYGSATCKLMHWEFKEKQNLEENAEKNKIDGVTDVIDSFGLAITKSHHFYDIGQGEEDNKQYDDIIEVFGASGALAAFRKEALQAIAYKNAKGSLEFYDELIHYKNDIDLAYRLQWAGFPCLLVKSTKVWHDRQVSGNVSLSKTSGMLKTRKEKTPWIKENSFFGHVVVLKKNFFGQPFSPMVKIKTWFMHLLRLSYISIFERELLKQFETIKKHQKEIEDKAKKMARRVSTRELEKIMK